MVVTSETAVETAPTTTAAATATGVVGGDSDSDDVTDADPVDVDAPYDVLVHFLAD